MKETGNTPEPGKRKRWRQTVGKDLTVAEITQRRGIPGTVLRYWIEHGLKADMRGGSWFISEDDLDRFMKRRVKVETRYKLIAEDELTEDDLKDSLK